MSEPDSPFDLSRPLRLVLDTNVIMALWHFADPALRAFRMFAESPAAVLLSRAECLDELQRVLAYSQFGLEPARQLELFDTYRARVECLPAASEGESDGVTLPRCGDRDDQKFVVLAWEGKADALVTRDKLVLRLARRAPLRGAVAILTPERLQADLLKSGTLAP